VNRNHPKRQKIRLIGGQKEGQSIVVRRAAPERRGNLTWPATPDSKTDFQSSKHAPVCNRNATLKAERKRSDGEKMNRIHGKQCK
jgi:hypothetical protein